MIESITIYEDDDILLIDKPSGTVVNRSETTKSTTIQDYIQAKYNLDQKVYQDDEFISRSGIVHRLDKDTSGILAIAKNPESFAFLKNQFKQKEVEKEYIAIVLGKVEDKFFEVDAPIKRDIYNRLKMSINSEGRAAFTSFETVEVKGIKDVTVTKIFARPKTGRMHQIRVHLLAINHPVMSDPIYMTRQQLLISKSIFNRLMLHAYRVKFMHPKSKKEVIFEANIPQAFNI